MRITSHIQYMQQRQTVQQGFSKLEEVLQRGRTGLRVSKPSDDPGAAPQILDMNSRIRALTQHRRNADSATARVASEESVLQSVTGVLSRARELAIAEAGDLGNAQTRAAASAEVDELLQTVLGHANMKHGTAYLFGGRFADLKPFDANGDPTPGSPPVGEHRFEVADGQIAVANHDGQSVFLDSNVIASLKALQSALATNDGATIGASIDGLDNAFDVVQTLTAEIGARSNQIDRIAEQRDSLELALVSRRSELQDADLAEVILELATRQTALEGALAATGRALGLSLTDYLR